LIIFAIPPRRHAASRQLPEYFLSSATFSIFDFRHYAFAFASHATILLRQFFTIR
jgi:hypothetical protein